MRCRPGEDDLSCSRLVASAVATAVFQSRSLRGRCCLGRDDCLVEDRGNPAEGVVLVGTVVLRTTMGRQCVWTLVTTVRQFQVLPRTFMVAKSLVIGDHCRTVSSLVQDLMSGIRLLQQQVGPVVLMSE